MTTGAHWLEMLDEEDLAFIRRFVLTSGSLKALAQEYGISYPTVRTRLDRLIAKMRAAESHAHLSEFERLLRVYLADGRLELETMRTLLRAHHKETRKTP